MSPPPNQSADLDQLLAEHGPWLLAWAKRRCVEADAAQDLVQEAFVALLQSESLPEAEALPAYLLGIVRNLIRRGARRKRVQRRAIEELQITSARPKTPLPEVAWLQAALADLPEELEITVSAYYARNTTYEDVAASLGVTRAVVQSRLRRAKKLLRARAGEEGL